MAPWMERLKEELSFKKKPPTITNVGERGPELFMPKGAPMSDVTLETLNAKLDQLLAIARTPPITPAGGWSPPSSTNWRDAATGITSDDGKWTVGDLMAGRTKVTPIDYWQARARAQGLEPSQAGSVIGGPLADLANVQLATHYSSLVDQMLANIGAAKPSGAEWGGGGQGTNQGRRPSGQTPTPSGGSDETL